MAEVFISYKSERRNAAQHLARVVELYGYSVWFDYWLASGNDFGQQIELQLTDAKAVVVLWCPLSRKSRWVLEEAHFAQCHDKLAPAWLERVEPPLGFGRADTIDLSIWDGAPRGHGLDRLLDEIARFVGRDPQLNFRKAREYEGTWRGFGAPRLAGFPLIDPLREREENRGLERAFEIGGARNAENRPRASEAEVGRMEERERRKAVEAEARRAEEERRKAAETEAQRVEEEHRRAAVELEEACDIGQERLGALESELFNAEEAHREPASIPTEAALAPRKPVSIMFILSLAGAALAVVGFGVGPKLMENTDHPPKRYR